MTFKPFPRRRLVSALRSTASFTAFVFSVSIGRAQIAPAPTTTAAGMRNAANDESVQLSPFEVKADSDNSYGALNSNSITRFNTELSKLPISADVMSEAFMQDVAAISVEAMISTYSGGAGFANFNAAGQAGAATNQPGENNSPAFTTLRGLTASTTRRDGFMSMTTFNSSGSTSGGYTSNFDIEKVEIINGPQSLLYGNGGAGGVINLVSKRARFNRPLSGSFQFRVDENGSKEGLVDLGIGNDKLALRFSFVRGYEGTRRAWIGGHINGTYAQIAYQPFHNTVVRVTMAETSFDRITPIQPTLTAANTADDGRNGQSLRYLLATNQINASATGKSGAGVIANGTLDWDNIDSLFGWKKSISSHVQRGDISAETRWTSWHFTQLTAGLLDFKDDNHSPGQAFYAPNSPTNPLPGHWTIASTAGGPTTDQAHPSHTKAIRFSVLSENDLFGGRARSKTILGVDAENFDLKFDTTQYYLADSNFNVVVNPATLSNATLQGRTLIPPFAWAVDNGPIQYAGFRPGAPYVTLSGVNYVRQVSNPQNTQPVTAENPLGVAIGGAASQRREGRNRGIYGTNNTEWLDGRLDSLIGFRLADSSSAWLSQGAVPQKGTTSTGATSLAKGKNLSYSFGLNYAVYKWLRPYVSISDSYNPPVNQNNDPYSNLAATAHAVGEEIGIKLQNAKGTISGSLAAYNVRSKNEQYSIQAALGTDINPRGLNGRAGANPNNFINIDRTSRGVQLTITATPTENWRLRLSAGYIRGIIGNTSSYAQLYNDQFYANSQGQVTYRDGTPVYVRPTFTAAQPVADATTAGAVPLTIAAMNSPSSVYHANPVAVTGQINSTSNAARVLQVVDPVHGAILTGATGLPISAMQINPGFALPGTIVTSRAGDRTNGNPEYSLNLTSVYTVPKGWLKGFRVGGSALLGWRNTAFYYYPAGVSISGGSELFSYPNQVRFDLIAGYTKRFRKITWSSQINVSNLFNRYRVIILPNSTTGWVGALNATFDQQPRSYLFSNTISF